MEDRRLKENGRQKFYKRMEDRKLKENGRQKIEREWKIEI